MAEVNLNKEPEIWGPAETNSQIKGSEQKLLAQKTEDAANKDVQIPMLSREEVAHSLNQENTESPNIKEESELCIKQEEDQLLEFSFAPVSEATEEKEDKSSVLLQRPTEENREECNEEDSGAGPGCSSDPHLQSESKEQTVSSSDSDDSKHWTPDMELPTSKGRPSQNTTSFSRRKCDANSLLESSDMVMNDNLFLSDIGSKTKRHKCSQCGWAFQRTTDLKRHTLTHTGEKPFSCSVCKKGFSVKEALKSHMRIHTGEKPFSCSVCNKSFRHKSTVGEHMRTHTGERPFICSVCKKCFTHNSHLRTHMRSHTGERPFSCLECGKTFQRNQHLRSHLAVHSREKPFSCPVCQKPFAQRGHLSTHMLTHTGEKPYNCLVCNKTFRHNSHLKTHMRSHTGERPFSCLECGKTFYQNQHLRSHLVVHSGERPFSCPVCEKCFTCSDYLQRHMKTHRQEKVSDSYECVDLTEN